MRCFVELTDQTLPISITVIWRRARRISARRSPRGRAIWVARCGGVVGDCVSFSLRARSFPRAARQGRAQGPDDDRGRGHKARWIILRTCKGGHSTAILIRSAAPEPAQFGASTITSENFAKTVPGAVSLDETRCKPRLRHQQVLVRDRLDACHCSSTRSGVARRPWRSPLAVALMPLRVMRSGAGPAEAPGGVVIEIIHGGDGPRLSVSSAHQASDRPRHRPEPLLRTIRRQRLGHGARMAVIGGDAGHVAEGKQGAAAEKGSHGHDENQLPQYPLPGIGSI